MSKKMIKKIIKFISRPKEYYPNIYIFSYHVLKSCQKILIKFKFIKNGGLPEKDMFNWSLYNLHYKGELIEARKNYTTDLKTGDYVFTNKKLIKKNNIIKPLHPNHCFLYETILQLNPSSIFEMGCGGGMHLHNLQILNPNFRLTGIDLIEKQIQLLHKTYPDLNATIKQADATLPSSIESPPADLSFTQAVIMHIHTKDKHLQALANLFKMAKKYVVLYESMKNHPFMEDIKKLHVEKKILWDNIYFYYRINKENDLPSSMICSSEKLPYPELTDYNIYFR